MPSVNMPNNGPPIIPNIVSAACSMPPNNWAVIYGILIYCSEITSALHELATQKCEGNANQPIDKSGNFRWQCRFTVNQWLLANI